jgi:hypothetical protein
MKLSKVTARPCEMQSPITQLYCPYVSTFRIVELNPAVPRAILTVKRHIHTPSDTMGACHRLHHLMLRRRLLLLGHWWRSL